MLVLRYSMIYLNPASVPLHIPLGILPTPLECALACPPSRNSFIRNTYKTPSQVLLLKDLNPFRCNTYRKSARNSFRSNTYKKHRGTPPPIFQVHLYLPSARRIAGIVFNKIPRSIRRLQFSMYSRSRAMFVSNDGSRRDLICHKPVMPGFTSSRRRCSSV